MQKLVTRFSLFIFLLLGVISTDSVSMDDKRLLEDAPPPRPAQRATKAEEHQTAMQYSSIQYYYVKKGDSLEVRRAAFKSALARTKQDAQATMDNYYTVELLEKGTKPRKNFGAAGALLDFVADAYQKKHREVLAKLVQSGKLDRKRQNPHTRKLEWEFLNGSYVRVINDALFKLAGAALQRPREDGGVASAPGRPPVVKLNAAAVKPKKKDDNCPC